MLNLSEETVMCLLFLPPVFSFSFLFSAIRSLYSMGKSKTKIKKEKQEKSVWQKLLLVGYAESCRDHKRAARNLRFLYWAMIVSFLVCLFLWAGAKMHFMDFGLCQICILGKVLILDVPICFASFFFTKHGKNGGVVWRWEE